MDRDAHKRSRRRWTVTYVVLLVIAASSTCFPLRVARPIVGTVVDEESGRPISQAIVELAVHAYGWLGVVHPAETFLDETWTRSDQDGTFRIGGGVNLLFPLWTRWNNQITVQAPGYFGESPKVVDAGRRGWPLLWRSPVEVNLSPMRSRLDLDEGLSYPLSLFWVYEARDAYREAYRRMVLDCKGEVGVMTEVEGARFDSLITGRWGEVFAHDAAKGRFVGWDRRGKLLDGPTTAQRLSAAQAEESLQRKYSDQRRLTQKAGTVAGGLDDVSRLRYGHEKLESPRLVRRTGSPTTLERLGGVRRLMLPPNVEGWVLNAHAGFNNREGCCHFVVATDRGIWLYDLPRGQEDRPIEVDPVRFDAMPGAPKEFLDLGVTDNPGRLYAVAGDERIYRFSLAGKPDQRCTTSVPRPSS